MLISYKSIYYYLRSFALIGSLLIGYCGQVLWARPKVKTDLNSLVYKLSAPRSSKMGWEGSFMKKNYDLSKNLKNLHWKYAQKDNFSPQLPPKVLYFDFILLSSFLKLDQMLMQILKACCMQI